jgi:hypothetical protein
MMPGCLPGCCIMHATTIRTFMHHDMIDMMMATTSSYLVVRGALWLLFLSLHLFKFLVV